VRHADASGTLERLTHDAEATRAFAAGLGALLRAGDLVLLEGGLGAGKTVFVQGLARGLGLDSAVKSPTFTLLHEHKAGTGGARLAHLDLYRIPPGKDLTDLALDELLDRSAVAVEWGGRLADAYPDHVHVALATVADGAPDDRRAVLVGHGPRGSALVEALRQGKAAASSGMA
jgi:tRNA threonylcarbamoyladenosine biosynthesis protein TsaE